MADCLSEDLAAEFTAAFSHCCPPGESTIAMSELGMVMRSLGQNPSEAKLKEMIDEFDADGHGRISLPNFLILMARKMDGVDAQADLIRAFEFFDRDGSGHVSAIELRRVLTGLGDRLTDEAVDEMIQEASPDSNDQIDYARFVTLMCG
eukprot:NODE_5786_length_555_cov_252.408000.p1 GENE.NODE_5786_length_555_cov_252.408000~~NODE_5786_length_555_cov_252.408000.p1  ORF type:complete len:149 (-),score=28.93 NODE_5786_length_555_cov_252.408000:10-456(-)